MADDALLESHREWIGYVQPVGLLVAPAALAARGVLPDKNIAPLQKELEALVTRDEDDAPLVRDFPTFAKAFLGWGDTDLAGSAGGSALGDALSAPLIEYNETLVPSHAVPAANPADGEPAWQMLIAVEPDDIEFDKDVEDDGKRWVASPHARFERLLRETSIPIGLLTNGRAFRLIYAPKGETSGFATFKLAEMLEVSGRPMLSAFHMLLQVNRLFGVSEQSLPALLSESRQYQERVSTQLAEQVLAALHELLRGFVAADRRLNRTDVVDLARQDPDRLYAGLLTVLMRTVFILYAEDRGLFPRDSVWVQNYSLAGLWERLRDDAALYPDTMDDRFGAWAQLVALWRLIHQGGRHGGMHLVARRGRLFDPERFLFLEGRSTAEQPISLPPIADGVVGRMLNRLMVLDGERLSYRTLDVEHIGSVYQAVMGFTVELTAGRSVAIRAPKRGGAAATVNLEELLATPASKRAEWIRLRTDRKLTAKQLTPVKDSTSLEALEAALDTFIDRDVTPVAVPKNVPVLQPTEARRKTGSHYTPRALTQPIVAEALRPVLERLGTDVTPSQILDLKVVDPAVGSGAFLVEACRQLADRLVASWDRHHAVPKLPPDEDALLHARRLIAQRCLYGVDRNAMATDLAKLSLWLVTLARDHEFTFLDHAIRHGDALVGLDLELIGGLHWERGRLVPFAAKTVNERVRQVEEQRRLIREASDNAGEETLRPWLDRADKALSDVALIGDAVLAAFFSADKKKAREEARSKVIEVIDLGGPHWQDRMKKIADALGSTAPPVHPFHWQIQFPEVFLRDNPGFDIIVGNPPYAGKNTIISGNAPHYLDWLKTLHEGAHGNADLIAHFFRRAFNLLRRGGTFGLLATNTIRQGDTRATGLRFIRQNGGIIYSARRRFKWPGEAAVVVSVIHVAKGEYSGPVMLDGRLVERITAFLFDKSIDDDPARLVSNADKSFQGSIVLGMGFTFDDHDTKGVALPLARRDELIAADARNAERIYPYIGGEEVNSDPNHAHHRYVINFEDFPLRRDSSLKSWHQSTPEERRDMRRNGIVSSDYPDPVAWDWPDLIKIVESNVKPTRDKDNREARKRFWWRYAERATGLYHAVRNNDRVLAASRVSKHVAFTFIPNGMIYDVALNIISISTFDIFAILQSRIHEVWARFFASSLEDRLRYTPSDVFETFPFPARINDLQEVGRHYFEHRAALMVEANEGMTDIYNRFDDPNLNRAGEPIQRLRELHNEMDHDVLRAYGWDDLIERSVPVFGPEWDDGEDQGRWRLRWPEDVRDEVLARLLDLNAERAREERRLGLTHNNRDRDEDDENSPEEFTLVG